jgi:Putative prokaryotic signal transducing protein
VGDRLVKLAEFENDFDAETLRLRLEDEGIKAVVTGQNIHGLICADGMVNVQVEILEKDLSRAKQILDAQESASGQQKDDQ